MLQTQPDITKEIWAEFKRTRSSVLQEKIFRHYEHLVYNSANRRLKKSQSLLGGGLDFEDIESAAKYGLLRAVNEYKPELKNKFTTFAISLINAQIIHIMRVNDPVGRTGSRAIKAITQAKEECAVAGVEVTITVLCQRTGFSRHVVEAVEHGGKELRTPCSIHKPILMGDGDAHLLEEILPDQRINVLATIMENSRNNVLREAVQQLPKREKHIIEQHFWGKQTLRDLSKDINVSETRTYQLYRRACKMLSERLECNKELFN